MGRQGGIGGALRGQGGVQSHSDGAGERGHSQHYLRGQQRGHPAGREAVLRGQLHDQRYRAGAQGHG